MVLLLITLSINFPPLSPQDEGELTATLICRGIRYAEFEGYRFRPYASFEYSVGDDPPGWALRGISIYFDDLNIDPKKVWECFETNCFFSYAGGSPGNTYATYYSMDRDIRFENSFGIDVTGDIDIRMLYEIREEITLHPDGHGRWRAVLNLNLDELNQSGFFRSIYFFIVFDRPLVNITLQDPNSRVIIGEGRIEPYNDVSTILSIYYIYLWFERSLNGAWVVEAEFGESTAPTERCFHTSISAVNDSSETISLNPSQEIHITTHTPPGWFLDDIYVYCRVLGGDPDDVSADGHVYIKRYPGSSRMEFYGLGDFTIRNNGSTPINLYLSYTIFIYTPNVETRMDENGEGMYFYVPPEDECCPPSFTFDGLYISLDYYTKIYGVFYNNERADHILDQEKSRSAFFYGSFRSVWIDPYIGEIPSEGFWFFKAEMALLFVSSEFGDVFGTGVYCPSDNISFGVNQTLIDLGNDTCWMFAGWIGSGEGSYTGSEDVAQVYFTSAHPIFEEATWTRGYRLGISTPYGEAEGEGWYEASSTVHVEISPTIIDHGNFTRRVFKGWVGFTPGEAGIDVYVNSPLHLTAEWETEYYVNVTSEYGAVRGAGWYTKGSTASISISPIEYTGIFTVKRFIGWYADGQLASASPSYTFEVSSPITLEARWKEELNWMLLVIIILISVIAAVAIFYILRRGKKVEVAPEELPPPPPPPP